VTRPPPGAGQTKGASRLAATGPLLTDPYATESSASSNWLAYRS